MPQLSPTPATSSEFEPLCYDTLEVYCERAGFCVAHAGPVVVPVWTRTAKAEHVELIGEAQRHVLRAYPKLAVATIIRAELSMSVPDDVRKAGRANVEEFGNSTVGSVMVVEGGGLRASFFRSVVTGVYFLTRSSSPQKVSSSIDDGLAWLFEPLRSGANGSPTLPADKLAALRADIKCFADDVTERYPSEDRL